ncbi:site-specific DNA-methyltransferase [Thermomonas carbonis]|uniref:Methyltransferase n=1 Tax=Thermomonas carbonis TaxID=1463158 RepID=A0A7G9SLP5_9GAMM|nr:DNA methyltransferase [Thermomonas carbonis]QNN68770.1 ParB N-terminal domain-containing protein [Thermomonas carbonis]GHC08903.1 methyltransferase [Thermomonas carbonis]
MASQSLNIEQRSIDSFTPWAGNPRSHSDKQLAQLAKSIQTFGFNCPVLIDANNNVIAGHGRLLAARQLGWTQVPAIALEHLTPQQVQAYRIADNRLTDLSEWDDALLAGELKALHEADLDFDLTAIGFELPEIDLRIQSLSLDGTEAPTPPTPSHGETVTQLGDLWLLGKHRMVCGNALDAAAYAVLLAGERADLVISDLPFNRSVTRDLSHNGKVQHDEFPMASGEMTSAEFTSFLAQTFGQVQAHLVDGALVYAFMDWRGMTEILTAGQALAWELKNLVVWNKGVGGMGSFYRSQHELIFLLKAGRGKHTNNVQLGRFGRNRTNVWDYPGSNAFSRQGAEGELLKLHPTIKPLELIADAILDASERDGVVLDPFVGSGTALLACEKTGRRGRAIELDPRYVDLTVLRWEHMTGQKAVHAETGLSRDALRDSRAEGGAS